MNKTIYPSSVLGKIKSPASKSFMQRAIALSVLTHGETIIDNPSHCDDALVGLNIAANFGCKIFDNGDFISIISKKDTKPEKLYCGESGLAIRLFAPVVSLFSHRVELYAEGSLLRRPADFMADVFKQLKVDFATEKDFPPIKIKGPLTPAEIELDGSLSSQFLSGLLITLPLANGNSIINVNNLKSIPYVEMTLKAVEAFGGIIENNNFKTFKIKGNQQYNPIKYQIEGDWSGAAGLLIAGAVSGKITITKLKTPSTQADYAVIDAIEQTGAMVFQDKKNSMVTVIKPEDKLKAFDFDAEHCPDLFPVLTALAVNCSGISKIKGVHRLAHKESNRGEVLKNEFAKLGVNIQIKDDTMFIEGIKVKSGKVFANNDHRIAMAFAVAALNADNFVEIEGAECVNKTYPEFFNDLEKLGVIVE
jgi:3-phosphoshikimate 1-carboxyvinyltransferase